MMGFNKNGLNFELDDVNLLLTDQTRKSMTEEHLRFLQNTLDSSLQWVYLGVAFFAVLSLLLILRIPRGRELFSVDD